MKFYSEAAMERAMKVQEVILRAIGKRITWWQAAEILGISCRSRSARHRAQLYVAEAGAAIPNNSRVVGVAEIDEGQDHSSGNLVTEYSSQFPRQIQLGLTQSAPTQFEP